MSVNSLPESSSSSEDSHLTSRFDIRPCLADYREPFDLQSECVRSKPDKYIFSDNLYWYKTEMTCMLLEVENPQLQTCIIVQLSASWHRGADIHYTGCTISDLLGVLFPLTLQPFLMIVYVVFPKRGERRCYACTGVVGLENDGSEYALILRDDCSASYRYFISQKHRSYTWFKI